MIWRDGKKALKTLQASLYYLREIRSGYGFGCSYDLDWKNATKVSTFTGR